MKRYTFVVLFIIVLIFLMPLMYLAFMYYVWNFNDYKHIKSVYLQGKTYSLYKKKKCKKQCYYIALCVGNDVEEGCPVNEALMDYAEFLFKSDKIYDISVKGDTFLISSSKDIEDLWNCRIESKNDNQILYKFNLDRRSLYSGNYSILVEYNSGVK